MKITIFCNFYNTQKLASDNSNRERNGERGTYTEENH